MPPSSERPTERPTRTIPRKRLLGLLLIVGAVAAAAPLLGTMASERTITVRLPDVTAAGGAGRVQLQLFDTDGDVVWSYDGAARPQVSRTLQLQDGRYELIARLGSGTVSRHIDVVEGATTIVIPLDRLQD